MIPFSPPKNRNIIQNSWVVPDVRVAAEAWTRATGVGPFFIVEGITLEDQLYRGRSTSLEVSYALAQAGEIQIEFVAQHNDAPSAYRDTIPAGGSGFHHVALYCDDYDADLAFYTSSSAQVAFSAAFAGKRICYVDTSAQLGCMIELIERSDAQDHLFALLRESARDFDGRHPIRTAF